jgi:hypothetical protein
MAPPDQFSFAGFPGQDGTVAHVGTIPPLYDDIECN